MIHIRVDNEELNINRKFACGIGPELPEGDVWVETVMKAAAFLGSHPDVEHCPGCLGEKRPKLGTPISELSGRKFCEIARSWGYD